MTTERDEIEAWLSRIEKSAQTEDALQNEDLLAPKDPTLDKLLALVRVYREANQFYAEQFTWCRVSADAQHMGAAPGFDFAGMYADKARAAELKAKEIVEGK